MSRKTGVRETKTGCAARFTARWYRRVREPAAHRAGAAGGRSCGRSCGLQRTASMGVAHAAILADGQALAGEREFRVADLLAFAGFQAPGGGLVRGGHGPV